MGGNHNMFCSGNRPQKQHIYPVEDIKPHEMTDTCWCNPTVDEEDDIVIHNSADRREMYEEFPLQ